nr:phosphatidylglycerol lysyltransferase domain-containing protein [Fusobacterium gastrosuis]
MWKKLTLESKNSIDEYTKGRFDISDNTFTNLYLWSFGEDTEYKIENDILLIKSVYEGEVYYHMPMPKYEKYEDEETIKKMVEIIKKLIEEKASILYFTEYWVEKLKKYFEFKEARYLEDYIYSVESLAYLKGRSYAKKKNRVSNFKRNYEYTYEKITEANIKEVIEFQKLWAKLNIDKDQEVLISETMGIIEVLKNFEHLDAIGGLLRVDGKIVAYTLGEELNEKMFVIHVEKALIEYIGSYQAINMIFLQEEALKYEFVNREDDFGDEGLREAKMSYKPINLLKKFSIEY